jgi:hypothetical protein
VVRKRVARLEERVGHRMSATTMGVRFRAGIVGVAPAVLLAAFVYHPYITPPQIRRRSLRRPPPTRRAGALHTSP